MGKVNRTIIIVIGILLAISIRLILLPNPGFEADIAFWKSWGLGPFDHGVLWASQYTSSNYPTPFYYFLWGMIQLYSLLGGDPHAFNQFWSNTNILFLFVSKLPSILSDFGIAGIVLFLGRHGKSLGFPSIPRSSLLLITLYLLLNPVLIIGGAWWGQIDSVGVFMFLIAVVLVLKRYPFLAGLVYIAAVMTKLQNMIYGPVFFLFLWQREGYEGLVKGFAGSVLGFFGLNIEFLLSRNMNRVIASLTENYDYFPLLSLNAYNPWWVVAKARGMEVSDKLLALGLVNAKTLGLFLFSNLYLLSIMRQIVQTLRAKNPLKTFIESLIIINAAFFLFQTQSHDRYAIPLSIFLLLWAPFYIHENQSVPLPAMRFALFYGLFSLVYFYNLHTALVVNYPQNGLPLLRLLTQPFFTITTSFVLLGLFIVFLFTILRNTQYKLLTIFLPVSCFLFLVSFKNLPLFTRSDISLTTMTPLISQQGYGKLMTDMPVGAGDGFGKWSPLSVQYAFYKTGIGTHANSFIEFDIGGHFRRFTADYGIDTQAGESGSAIFELYGDGKLLFRSEKIGRYDMPRHIVADIDGVKRLGLVTTDAGDGNSNDHADWLRPTLWP